MKMLESQEAGRIEGMKVELNSEVGMRKSEKRKKMGRSIEFGSRTRRRPKRTGLCRGKDAEVGKKKEGGRQKGLDARRLGCREAWMPGSLDARRLGCQEAWMPGSLDAGKLGCLKAGQLYFFCVIAFEPPSLPVGRLGCREGIMIEYKIDIDLIIHAKAGIQPLK